MKTAYDTLVLDVRTQRRVIDYLAFNVVVYR